MKIISESNLKEILDKQPCEGVMTLFPFSQEGTEKTERIKTHFLFLGEIAKIHTIEGNTDLSGSWKILSRLSFSVVQLPIHTYSLEVSVWKVVALIALLPIFFIQRIFGVTGGPLTREVTLNNVKIEASRDATGKVSMNLGKIEPIMLHEQKTA